MSNFCHLHVHTEFSVLDGTGTAKEWGEKTKNLGQEYLACTDHGNIDGLITFQTNIRKAGLKPILGCELYVVSDIKKKETEKRSHITVLIKEDIGFQNLCRILTLANLKGFYYRPITDFSTILKHSKGLVFLSGCSASPLKTEEGTRFLMDLSKEVGDDFYLEVMPHLMDEQRNINQCCKDFQGYVGSNVNLVATNDCHYIKQEDAILQEIAMAIQMQKKWADSDRFKFSIDTLFLRSEAEMKEAFKAQGVLSKGQYLSAIANTIEVAEKCCNFEIKKRDIWLPSVRGIKDVDEPEFLRQLCDQGYRKRFETSKWDSKHQSRMEEEFALIKKKGFIRYFLLVWDLINWCKDNNIIVGPGRGCFLPETQIYLPFDSKIGYVAKSIKDISVGDEIISHNGEIGIVENKFEYEIEEDICDVYIEDVKISCTKDHRFFSDKGWKNAQDLSTKDRVISSKEKYKIKTNASFQIDKKRLSDQYCRKNIGRGNLKFGRCKTNVEGVSLSSIFYLQRMWKRIKNANKKYFTSAIWSCLFSNLSKLYCVDKQQSRGKDKTKFGSAKNCTKQTGCYSETKRISEKSSFERSKLDIEKKCRDKMCQSSRSYKKTSSKAQE